MVIPGAAFAFCSGVRRSCVSKSHVGCPWEAGATASTSASGIRGPIRAENPLCSKIPCPQGSLTPWDRCWCLGSGQRDAAGAWKVIPGLPQPNASQHFAWESLTGASPSPTEPFCLCFCFIFLLQGIFSALKGTHLPSRARTSSVQGDEKGGKRKGWIQEGKDKPGSCAGPGPESSTFLHFPHSPQGEIKWDLG